MADKILVIDDDPSIAELINLILKPRGLTTYHAVDGQEGLKQAYELQPDLIILDIMMPAHDGYEICARLREFSDVPILMLTAKSQSSDVTHGFAVGADDYVKKPFSNDELISRIESLLRRKKNNNANTNITGYSDGYLEVEIASQKVMLEGEEISLTPTEFKLLAFLIRHPQKTLSTRTLLSELWGNVYSHDKALLSLYIHQLRQKLNESEREHKYIQTQWGQGYWFNPLPQVQKQAQKPLPEDISVEEQIIPEIAQKEASETSNKLNWVWILLLIPILLIAAKWLDINSSIYSPQANRGSTAIEAIGTAEGFTDGDNTGVRGQVCISNQGKHPTDNLSIVDTVHAIGEQQKAISSAIIDLGYYPIISPDQSLCYPYEIIFDTLPEQNVNYRNIISVTITNYSGLEIGSQHCPGPEACAFGPTIISDFSFQEQ